VCVLLEFLQKNIGDPYYEPTIVVHDYTAKATTMASIGVYQII